MSLKDFKLLQKLGSGAYSTVHKVKRKDDGKLYALKKVRILLQNVQILTPNPNNIFALLTDVC